jgi:hypothetical protein
MNNHEKILIRDDKTKIKIIVRFWERHSSAVYDTYISICPPRKRKYQSIQREGDYSWRSLSLEARKEYDLRQMLEFVSAEELHTAKLELWEKLKPVL